VQTFTAVGGVLALTRAGGRALVAARLGDGRRRLLAGDEEEYDGRANDDPGDVHLTMITGFAILEPCRITR